METFFIRALQLILSLSILVVLHEFGHFFFARLFKVRVDKFYMFFNPTISLVRAKKINGQWQVRFFAKNVPANERPKRDADGDIIVDAKGRQVVEQIPLHELPDGDWRKYPETTEWGIGWLPLGGYCKIAGMIDESMDTSQLNAEPQPWEYRSKPVWQRHGNGVCDAADARAFQRALKAPKVEEFVLDDWAAQSTSEDVEDRLCLVDS